MRLYIISTLFKSPLGAGKRCLSCKSASGGKTRSAGEPDPGLSRCPRSAFPVTRRTLERDAPHAAKPPDREVAPAAGSRKPSPVTWLCACARPSRLRPLLGTGERRSPPSRTRFGLTVQPGRSRVNSVLLVAPGTRIAAQRPSIFAGSLVSGFGFCFFSLGVVAQFAAGVDLTRAAACPLNFAQTVPFFVSVLNLTLVAGWTKPPPCRSSLQTAEPTPTPVL